MTTGFAQPGSEPAEPSASRPAGALRRLLGRRTAQICLLVIGVIALAAAFGPLFGWSYSFQDSARYTALPAGPDARHWLGVDNLGQDELSRLVYGARVSLLVAVAVVTIEVLIGVPLGLISGYRGGMTDLALMRVTDVMFAFPDILLAILLASILRAGSQAISPVVSLAALFAALGVVGWPSMARLVRGQALALRSVPYVEAARAMGVRDRHILIRHLLPNLLGPVLVQATQDLASVILAEATLSFLGLGVEPPIPSWGRMIDDARPYMESHPGLLFLPAFALALTVMAFNFLGDALRDALDPRMRTARGATRERSPAGRT